MRQYYFFPLNLQQGNPVIASLLEYLIARAKQNVDLGEVGNLLNDPSKARVGLVLTERLINIPSEVVPPMYKMLLEEISWAIEEKEPYSFTHYLILSKTYKEVASLLDEEDDNTRTHKKQKKGGKLGASEIFFFHPEDEVLQKYAAVSGGFEYQKEAAEGQSDSKRTFQELGIKPQGQMILIEADQFGIAVKALQDYYGQS